MEINKLLKKIEGNNLVGAIIAQIFLLATGDEFVDPGDPVKNGEIVVGEMDFVEKVFYSLRQRYVNLLNKSDADCCDYVKKISCCDHTCITCDEGRTKIYTQCDTVDDWLWTSIFMKFPRYNNGSYTFCVRAGFKIAVIEDNVIPVGTFPVVRFSKEIS